VARKAAAGAENIFIIDSTEKINTFSLLPFARAGLVWLSSAGVDITVRGVPVLAAARPKYEGMGIVEEPASREVFFATLEKWARTPVRPTAQQITMGKRYMHFAFKGFSFEAIGRDYHAVTCYLNHMPSQAEHDRFYRILTGEEPPPDQS